MNKETPDVITLAEAAKRLNVHPRTVARAVHGGEIRAIFGGLHGTRIVGIYAESVAALRPAKTEHPAKK